MRGLVTPTLEGAALGAVLIALYSIFEFVL